ncbi:MAG: FixH family protein [Myxococcota bacterium]
MKNPIPPQWFWPGLIISLLLFSVGSQIWLVLASQSDHGVQIEDDYYTRALDWDITQEARQRSKALGWRVDVTLGDLHEDGQRVVTLHVVDRDGKPVEGLQGEVDVRRPSKAGVLGTSAFEAVPGKPGTYQLKASLQQRGLWDLTLRAQRNDTRFIAEFRREV